MAKRIQLKTETIIAGDKPFEFSYAEQIQKILKTPGPKGFGIEDIRQSLKIVDRIESEGNGIKESVVLEDSEWQFLVNKLKEFRWALADPVIVDFDNAIQKAEEVNLS